MENVYITYPEGSGAYEPNLSVKLNVTPKIVPLRNNQAFFCYAKYLSEVTP